VVQVVLVVLMANKDGRVLMVVRVVYMVVVLVAVAELVVL
tara:strand:+ start:284 stop:403 length:120 start_codon:yes stop_codon:yes gene_type:complete